MVQRYPDSIGHTIKSGARELGISHRTMRKAVEKGDVKVVDFGGINRITFEELERVRKLLRLRKRSYGEEPDQPTTA